ncbi:Biotin/lipoate A/B protein ligase family protein [Bosea lathyri]|uniref:Biotin/lipoate A/B protein ligase family protein n=2 Tax=Bosea lathyri TaxID=1036778 RepID=A0A1H5VLF6_9HYPH|nr:Biotin/lipoate A/B protein ligase family protein [Bosea lathyri]
MPLIASDTHATLSLPPGFSVVALRESGDAFAHACGKAAEEGAGTLVWVRRFDVAEFAVVLEPLEPLAQARKALFMAMNAVGDAISAHCPPERDVTFDWPDCIRFDGGLVGGARIGWPEGCAEDAVPDWLVVGAIIRVTFAGLVEPGQAPKAAALDDEGFDGLGPATLVESFARFFLRQVDIWQNNGFEPIASDYLARLAKERPGDDRELDGDGDLLTRSIVTSAVRRSSFRSGLEAAAWYDRDTGAPKL